MHLHSLETMSGSNDKSRPQITEPLNMHGDSIRHWVNATSLQRATRPQERHLCAWVPKLYMAQTHTHKHQAFKAFSDCRSLVHFTRLETLHNVSEEFFLKPSSSCMSLFGFRCNQRQPFCRRVWALCSHAPLFSTHHKQLALE